VPELPFPLPLESVIAAAVALDEALGQAKFPQARHHLHVLALRATAAACPDVHDLELALLFTLE
jgi:hypothetical protein